MQVSTLPTTPRDIRALIRKREMTHRTNGLVPNYVQANLAILPKDLAFDFLLFCQRNPKPCPLLEVVEAGSVEPKQLALGADIRRDIPKYRVYEHGMMTQEVEDICELWSDDLVSFLLGSSFSFETALVRAGIEMRHLSCGTNAPMFITTIPTMPTGVFSGALVVSMRPIPRDKVVRAVQVTSRFPSVHGAPIHIGDPETIGINDVTKPDLGDSVEIKRDEIPMFWACGVTPQVVAMNSKPPLMITHSPGHMFITDCLNEDLAAF